MLDSRFVGAGKGRVLIIFATFGGCWILVFDPGSGFFKSFGFYILVPGLDGIRLVDLHLPFQLGLDVFKLYLSDALTFTILCFNEDGFIEFRSEASVSTTFVEDRSQILADANVY